ncbi:MAG: hypothetical protein Fur0042_22900 [Cyanophyceae cyanobacterium]
MNIGGLEQTMGNGVTTGQGERMAATIAIAGTDTDAGKTIVTAAIAAYWLRHGGRRSLGLLKPVQSGIGDRERYHQWFGAQVDQTAESINPLWFEAPLAPPIAAQREGKSIDLAVAWRSLGALQRSRDLVLVEGAGGLGSPVTWELTVADVFYEWRLPTVLVVPVKLGAIAAAVANVALARQVGVNLRGMVLNCTAPRSAQEIADLAPADLLTTLTGVPVLGCIPHLADLETGDRPALGTTLAAAAANLDLERLLGAALRPGPTPLGALTGANA